MNVSPFRYWTAAMVVASATACGGTSTTSQQTGASSTSQASEVKLDGSSTVFPITEAVAEEFQKVEPERQGDRRHLRHRRRLQEVLPRRNRHLRCVPPDQADRGGACKKRRHRVHRAADRVRRPRDRGEPEEHVGEHDHGRRAEEDLGARGAGQDHPVEPGRPGWPDREIQLFGAGVDSGTYDYFTEAINGKAQVQPRRLHVERRRQRARAGRRGDENALGFFGFAYYEENKGKLKLVPVDDGKAENGDGPIAPSPDTMRNGTYQPLSRPLFIYVSEKALARPEVQKFVDFF